MHDNVSTCIVTWSGLPGNILLNIMLSSSIPLSRQGKNNVALICIPNPPLEEKKEGAGSDDKVPVSMLIKVKTAEDADELLEKLNEAKRWLYACALFMVG